MQPAVSICIPTMNSARTIRATVESALNQTYGDFEVVVTDNNSTDETIDLLSSFDDPRLRVVRAAERLPMGANWSRAVNNARGDLLKLVCSDDLISADCLAVQVPIMDDPGVSLVASRFDLIDDDGKTLKSAVGLADMSGRLDSTTVMRLFLRRLPDELFPSAAALFRRQDFDRTTGFRDDYGYTLDIDVWLQIAEFGGFVGCDESLAVNRASKFNFSSSTSTLEKARDIVGFNKWAAGHYGGPGGALRKSDRIAADARVARAMVRRVYMRSVGDRSRARRHDRLPSAN